MFGQVVRSLLSVRQISLTGAALARHLAQAGYPVHQATLRKLLNGETSPKKSTLEALVKGLGLSPDEERALRTAAAGRPTGLSDPAVIRLFDALGGWDQLDTGRRSEQVTWTYFVGRTDADDHCRERRLTQCGPDGVRLASFGPGELRKSSFDLLDLPNLLFRVTAAIHRPGGKAEPVNTMIHLIETEPGAGKFRTVVQFGTVEPHCRLEWVATYRWPGLWRTLRANGTASAGFGFPKASIKVTQAALELVTPDDLLADVAIHPRTSPEGIVNQKTSTGERTTTWTVKKPVERVYCEISAPSRAPQRCVL